MQKLNRGIFSLLLICALVCSLATAGSIHQFINADDDSDERASGFASGSNSDILKNLERFDNFRVHTAEQDEQLRNLAKLDTSNENIDVRNAGSDSRHFLNGAGGGRIQLIQFD